MTRAYLGLGSNEGERLENLLRAVELLRRLDVPVLRSSRVYETTPVGGPPQRDYLNAVIEVEAPGSPRELLETASKVEDRMGRVRGERWGPRVIDVDVLTFGEQDLEALDLQVPHPRMHERAFVLIPLLELDADPPLPGGRKVADLNVDVSAVEGVRPFAPPLVD